MNQKGFAPIIFILVIALVSAGIIGKVLFFTNREKPLLDKFSLWTNGTQLRGANIYQRRLYPEADGPEFMGTGFLGPPFTQEDFASLSQAGANLVVLSHPGLFDEKPPYSLNQKIQDNLDKFIEMAGSANLFVVIAARTGPGRSEMAIVRDEVGTWFDKTYINDDIWKDKKAQDAFVAMWKYTASRFRNNPLVVGYEILVEPNSEELLNDPYDWNILAARISSAIREVDSDTPILIGGLHYSGVRWLPYLKPTGDKRTVYTVHQYEPQEQYTHQKGVNSYPGRFDTNGDGIIREFNKDWLDNLLNDIDSFKSKYHVPVAVTEYGLQRFEPGGAEFLADEMELFEKRKVNYSIWEWSTAYKPLTDENNAFNFRFGPDKNNKTDTDSALYRIIKKYWQKNSLRPSAFKKLQ